MKTVNQCTWNSIELAMKRVFVQTLGRVLGSTLGQGKMR